MSHHYVVTAQKPTAVVACLTGKYGRGGKRGPYVVSPAKTETSMFAGCRITQA